MVLTGEKASLVPLFLLQAKFSIPFVEVRVCWLQATELPLLCLADTAEHDDVFLTIVFTLPLS